MCELPEGNPGHLPDYLLIFLEPDAQWFDEYFGFYLYQTKSGGILALRDGGDFAVFDDELSARSWIAGLTSWEERHQW